MRNRRLRTSLWLCFLVLLILMARSVASGAAAAAPTSTASPKSTQATIIATYTLPDIRLGSFQNAILPDSIANDRNLRVGSIGSDM